MASHPQQPDDTLFALALQQHQRGDLAKAKHLYEQLLSAHPQHPESLHLLGVLQHQMGQHQVALEYIGQALALKPNFPDAQSNLGAILMALNRPQEAVACYRQVLASQPTMAIAYNNLGNALNASNNLNALPDPALSAEAIACWEKAIALCPNYPEAHFNLGNMLHRLGRNEASILALQNALASRPHYAEAHFALGIALKTLGRYAEAVQAYQHAVANKPDAAPMHNNLGNALYLLGRYAEAAPCFQTAIALQADYSDAYSNLGNTYQALGRHTEALACYQTALSYDPEHADAKLNQSLCWLILGHFETGFRAYEMRWRCKATPALPPSPYPLWLGSTQTEGVADTQSALTQLAGKKILLQIEQGIGDAVQMLRYVPQLLAQGAECWMPLPEVLQTLVQRSFPALHVISPEAVLPEMDWRIPVMSLPLAMQTFSETAIRASFFSSLIRPPTGSAAAYLCADPARAGFWRTHLQQFCAMRTLRPERMLGVVWRGNPQHQHDRQRSLPLAELLPWLAAQSSTLFVSLQKGLSTAERAMLATLPNVLSLDAELSQFDETAAVMSQLDGLITIDSAPAHLAGALGKVFYLLLPYSPDWRWLRARPDSPWYPSARLLRQKALGEWQPVLEQLSALLQESPKG
ncbi:MAG: tetratricopeptide repeat protein [Pseudomonadota bacterium]